MKKIDWDKVWVSFERWHEEKFKFWHDQQKKIQSLVEAQLKRKKK